MLARWSRVFAGVAAIAGVVAVLLAPLGARAFARDPTLLLSLAAVLAGAVSLILNAAAFRSTTLAEKAGAAALAAVGFGLGAIAPETLPVCCGADVSPAIAIGSLRAISSAQSTYAASCAHGGYAIDLADLAKPAPGSSLGFISPDLNANGIVRGPYVITLVADPGAAVVTPAAKTCNRAAADAVSAYFAEAHPVAPGQGLRSYAAATNGAIYMNESGAVIGPGMAGAVPLR
jgi:hypothetical protein